MTVGELIEALSQCPPDMLVVCHYVDREYDEHRLFVPSVRPMRIRIRPGRWLDGSLDIEFASTEKPTPQDVDSMVLSESSA